MRNFLSKYNLLVSFIISILLAFALEFASRSSFLKKHIDIDEKTPLIYSLVVVIIYLLLTLLNDFYLKRQLKITDETNMSLYNELRELKDSLSDRCFVTALESAHETDKYLVIQLNNILNKMKYGHIQCVHVYDFVWLDNDPSTTTSYPDREKTVKQLNEAIKNICVNKFNIYKEIYTFVNEDRFKKLLEHLSSCKGKYYAAYFDSTEIEQVENFPKMQFVIIETYDTGRSHPHYEIVFASHAYGDSLCSIQHDKIGGIFINYFDNAWKSATKIQDEDKATREVKLFNNEFAKVINKHGTKELLNNESICSIELKKRINSMEKVDDHLKSEKEA